MAFVLLPLVEEVAADAFELMLDSLAGTELLRRVASSGSVLCTMYELDEWPALEPGSEEGLLEIAEDEGRLDALVTEAFNMDAGALATLPSLPDNAVAAALAYGSSIVSREKGADAVAESACVTSRSTICAYRS